MAFLIKEERQSLTRTERRELRQKLRQERRAEKKAAGGGPKFNIDWKKVDELATELILDMAGIAMPAEEKMQAVLDELVEQLDEFCTWTGVGTTLGGIFGGSIGALIGGLAAAGLEQVDGIALKAIADKFIEPQVQRVYDRLKAEGKVEESA